MKTIFDKIYVLSLITNKDRQEFIKYQFNKLNLDFEFIYGTDFYNFKNIDLIKSQTEDNYYLLHCRDFGCTLTHYNAVMQAYHLGYNNILIFEDDVCLNKDVNLLEDMFNNIPKKADFITYDPRTNKKNILYQIINNIIKYKNDKYFECNVSTYGGAAFAIMNRKTMKIYLDAQHNAFKMSDCVDYFFDNINTNILKKYISSKCIFIDQITHSRDIKDINNIIEEELDGYDNLYSLLDNFNRDDFFKPIIFNEHTRLV